MSRIVGRRVRSGDQETESTNQRLLRRGSVSTSAVQNRAVREIKRWPGGPRVRPGDLTAEAVEELDGRYVAGRTLTLLRDAPQEIGHDAGAGGLVEFTTAAGEWVGFGEVEVPTSAPRLPADGVWGLHVTLVLGDVPAGTEIAVVDADTGARLWPLGTSWTAGQDHPSPVHVGPLRVPHRPWDAGVRPAVRVIPPSGETVDVEYAEATWGIEGAEAPTSQLTLGGYEVRVSTSPSSFQLSRRLDGQGVNLDTLVSESMSLTSGTWYSVRARIDGPRIRARVWTGTEPSLWQIDYTDGDPVRQRAGMTGVSSPIPAGFGTTGERQVDSMEVSFGGGTPVSTDFSSLALGPLTGDAGWIDLATHLTGRWQVQSVTGATGGQAAVFGPHAGNDGHWVGWEGAGSGMDMEVVARVRAVDDQSVGIVLRGNVHAVGD